MSLEHKIEQAFDEVTAPASLKWNTLAAIEARRAAMEEAAAEAEAVEGFAAPGEARAEEASAALPAQAKAGSNPRSRAWHAWWKYALPVAACAVLAAVGVIGVNSLSVGPDAAQEVAATDSPATEAADQASPPASSALAPLEQAVAYVGIDVNPSLELALNDQDTVITAEAENADAEIVLATLDLAGLPYDEALATLLNAEAMVPYLADNATVDISVTTDDQALAQALVTQSDQLLAQYSYGGYCHQVDDATRTAAHEAGMGAGKYCVASELVELDPAYTLEDCSHMSMRQLHDAIDHHHNQAAASAPAQSQEQGTGAGTGQGQGNGYGQAAQAQGFAQSTPSYGHHAETHSGGHH